MFFAGQGLNCFALLFWLTGKLHHPIISDLQECKFHHGTMAIIAFYPCWLSRATSNMKEIGGMAYRLSPVY
jgi:hypothetical protein